MTELRPRPSAGTTRIQVSDPAQLFGAIPFVLGFHPAPGDVVVAALANGQVAGIARDAITTPADTLATALLTNFHHVPDIDSIIIAGYVGPQHETHLAELALLFHCAGYRLSEVFRAEQQRIFCLTCDCCGTDGIPYDPAASTVAVQAVVAGQVALPSRQAMLDKLAHDPAACARLEAVMDATIGQILTELPNDRQGTDFIDQVLARARTGQPLDDSTAARLILLLSVNLDWRDHAWCATGNQPSLAALWQDLTRRCPRDADMTAIPALAAWSAWRCGNTLLAHTALDIAAALDPEYSMAALLRDILHAGLPPSKLPWPTAGSHADAVMAAETAVS